MKPSLFNLIFPESDNLYLVYNTLHGSIFEVDEQGKEAIQGKIAFNFLPSEYQELLTTNGVMIDDDLDEMKEVQVKYERFKYDKRNLLFTILNSYECNLDCPYCYEKKNKEEIALDVDKARLIIQFITQQIIKNHSTGLSLFFFGGEPLLKPHLLLNVASILRQWCQANLVFFELGIVTNGTLLSPEIISQLKEFENVFIQITLDGPEEVHNKRRIYREGKGGTYSEIIGALQRCQQTNFKIKIRINVDQENCEQIPLLLDELIDHGLQGSKLTFAALTPLTKACALYGSYLEARRMSSILANLWEISLQKGFRLDISPKATPVYCGGLTDAAYIIDPYLDLYKCFGSVGLKEHRIGYLHREKGFIEDRAYYELLARNPFHFKKKSCLKCKLLPTCGGGCALGAYNLYGTYHAGCCDVFTKIIEKRVRLFLQYRPQIDEH